MIKRCEILSKQNLILNRQIQMDKFVSVLDKGSWRESMVGY